MAVEEVTKRQVAWRGIAAILGVFAGICAIFALVVTAAEAWQEHSHGRWPETIAHVERCGLDQTSTGRRDRYYIHCRLSYVVDTEESVTNIYSTTVPSSDVWQYPHNQIAPFEEWVNRHPPGTSIKVRYDPANHKRAILVATDMPRGGPRTDSNLKLVGFFAASTVLLLSMARIWRLKSDAGTVIANS